MDIKEVDAMTVQQAIEYSLDKLVQQGERCRDGHVCTYGDGEGNHCAVGWLLDARAEALMRYEGSVREIAGKFSIPELIKNNIEVFSLLQAFHDDARGHGRRNILNRLSELDVDISHPNFQAWVDLGE